MGQLSQLETHPLAQSSRPTSDDALDVSSVKKTNFLSVFMYFLDLSMRKSLCLGVINGLLIILLIKAIPTRIHLLVVCTMFGSPHSLKILLLVAPGILYVRFSINIALTLILNPRHQNDVSSLKDVSKILSQSLHGELFFHQLIYLSCLLYFFIYNKRFVAFC